jgi:hypothetical protein
MFHAYTPLIRKLTATKYKTTVRIRPEMTVPHSESKGFFMKFLLINLGVVLVWKGVALKSDIFSETALGRKH